MTVEILKQLLVSVVQTSMRFIRDDQIEEPDVERFVDSHHRWIGREIDSAVAIVCCRS